MAQLPALSLSGADTGVSPVLSLNYYDKGTNAAIYPGDFVLIGADGKAVVATAGNTQLLGVAQGYQAATSTTVLIADHPDQQFYIQDDGAAATLSATSIGSNADIVATAGNATFLKSQHTLDASGVTLATAQLRLLGIHPSDTFGKYVRVRVAINEHARRTTTGV